MSPSLFSCLAVIANHPLYDILPASTQPLYLVGGTIRDAFLGEESKDIDLVMEASAQQVIAYAQQLAQQTHANLEPHTDFGTATLLLPDGIQLDIAMARAESYPHPAALPQVRPSSIVEDMQRRDFSSNAMALELNTHAASLLDPFNGQQDIRKRQLRFLHPHSFRDDPTRIMRGVRLAARLDFTFEAETLAHIATAYAPEVLQHLSAARRKQELFLILQEEKPLPALRLLQDVGALAAFFHVYPSSQTWQALAQLPSHAPAESYLLLLLSDKKGAEHDKFFAWSQGLQKAVRHLEDTRARQQLNPLLLARGFQAKYGLGFAPLRYALKTLSPSIAAQIERLEARAQTRQLQGRDVLELLEKAQDKRIIGTILQQVAQARAQGDVSDFKEELQLAGALLASLASK